MASEIFGSIRKCPICGKQFYVPFADIWVYARDHRLVCSWSCLRQAEKVKLARRRDWTAKEGYKPPERWYRIREMRDKGMSNREIAEVFGFKETSVGHIISKLNKYEALKEGKT